MMCLLFAIASSNALYATAGKNHNTSAPDHDLDVASRFAPIFYQALGEAPRSDYITNFDFDGDWRGDNNWEHTNDPRFTLKAFVYYSVAETSTHFFLYYAIFHPRDYKGGENRGTILSELIREGIKRGGKYDPTGLGQEAVLAHENDMEGCLVIVAKNGKEPAKAQVAFVETLRHNTFLRYAAGEVAGYSSVRLDGNHPLLYVEPKGHGIQSFTGDGKQSAEKDFLVYEFKGVAGESEKATVCRNLETTPCRETVGYELLPIATTLWARARGAPNETYGESCEYSQLKLSIANGPKALERKFSIGKVGCAFRGTVGGINMARPPWGWFDLSQRDRPPGSWFFDPASLVKEHFVLDKSFSTSYLRPPFWATKVAEASTDKSR
jgi:hypothetical protein